MLRGKPHKNLSLKLKNIHKNKLYDFKKKFVALITDNIGSKKGDSHRPWYIEFGKFNFKDNAYAA